MNFNLDVNAIIQLVADGLGVATDAVMELYPMLVQEYALYRIFSILMIACIPFIVVGVFSMLFCALDGEAGWLGKATIIAGVIGAIGVVASMCAQWIFAPNVSLVLDLMSRM